MQSDKRQVYKERDWPEPTNRSPITNSTTGVNRFAIATVGEPLRSAAGVPQAEPIGVHTAFSSPGPIGAMEHLTSKLRYLEYVLLSE